MVCLKPKEGTRRNYQDVSLPKNMEDIDASDEEGEIKIIREQMDDLTEEYTANDIKIYEEKQEHKVEQFPRKISFTQIFDHNVNIECLVQHVNNNPGHTVRQMYSNGIPIFHYQCKYCQEVFLKIHKYFDHVVINHNNMQEEFNAKYKHYECYACKQRFLSLKDRHIHMSKIHSPYRDATQRSKFFKKGPKSMFICPHCNKEWTKLFDDQDRLSYLDHVIEHELGSKSIWCIECPLKFRKLNSLKRHIRIHHAVKNIVCTSCGETCADSKAFKDHNHKIHRIYKKRNNDPANYKPKRTSPEPRVCSQCGQEFAKSLYNYQSLQYHIKTKHADISQLLKCKHCGKLFVTKIEHNNHEVLHSDPKIPCHQCGKLFHSKKYLSRHTLSAHTENRDLPVHCTICSKGFINPQILNNHMNVHLGLKPYKCKYCPNVYQNASNCMSHEKKSHRDQYTRSVLSGVRVKDRDLGLIDI